MNRSLLLMLLLTAAGSAMPHDILADDNWPRFRGPNADGVAADNDRLPVTWNRTKNVEWVADVPGWGWACPILWGDQVFVSTVVSDEENDGPQKGLYLGQGVRTPAKGTHHWMVYCYDLKTGAVRWKYEAHTGQPKVPRHPKSTYASETPTTDGERLYVLFGDVGLYCFDYHGKQLWSHEIEPKKTFFDYGAAASPWAYNNRLFFLSEDGDTYVVEAGPEFKLLHSNSLDELCLSTPALSKEKLLIRTASKLYCITKSTSQQPQDAAE